MMNVALILGIFCFALFFCGWVGRKLYYRMTEEYLQIELLTPSGRIIKSGPLEANQENAEGVTNFLNSKEEVHLTFHQTLSKGIILPRLLVESSVITIKAIRRRS